jgi:DtxR family Mn-dependent transcriptional regulator
VAQSLSEKAVSKTMGLYLAELFRLGGGDEFVSPSALADALDVSPPAASRMGRRLTQLGLVDRAHYRGLRLTQAGRREGLRTIRRHRLAEAFLVREMGYGWHEAHDLADALAEIADETFVERMDEKAGHPRRCPHGEPIPTADGEMPVIHDVPLVTISEGEKVLVSRVRTRDSAGLQYLAEVGLVPEAMVLVEARAPFGGAYRLRIGSDECVLGSELAEVLTVTRMET